MRAYSRNGDFDFHVRMCDTPHCGDLIAFPDCLDGKLKCAKSWPRSIRLKALSARHQCQSDNGNAREERWQQEDIGNAQERDPEAARDAS